LALILYRKTWFELFNNKKVTGRSIIHSYSKENHWLPEEQGNQKDTWVKLLGYYHDGGDGFMDIYKDPTTLYMCNFL
jgi:hypothetical protein